MSRLARRSRAFVLGVSALSIGLLAIADHLAGPELRLFVFYWSAIAVTTWFGGRTWGLAFVALSGVAWIAANVPANESATWMRPWNAGVNLTSFGFLAYAVNVIREMVERERAAARTDPLTGAADGRAFLERAELEMRRCARDGRPLSLAYFDADNLKAVSDSLGHTAGDELLQRAAATIAIHVRATDCFARLGGDEFALLMPGADAGAAAQAVGRAHDALRELAASSGLQVSFSVGMLTCRGSACAPEQLIARADALMYEVKSAGKNGVRAVELPASA